MSVFNPLTWLRWISEFVQCWMLEVPWRDAPKAIPAVILSIALFTTGFIAFSEGAGWRNRLLDNQLAVSLEKDDYETAQIVISRQLEADPDNPELIHRFALIRDAQSFSDEATILMEQLLKRRHLPAAKWLLQNRLLGEKWTGFDDRELDRAGAILGLITESEPQNVSAKRMYTEYLIFRKRFASAIPFLVELSEQDPMLGLQAAAFARQLGDSSAAENYALRSLERVEQMQRDDPQNAFLAMSVARNQIFLKRHADAIKTLRRSVQVARKDNERRLLTQGLGDAIVSYVNFIEESPTNTIQERLRVLRMLDAAVKIAPNNPRVVTMLADRVLGSLDAANPEIQTVRQGLIDGAPIGISHFIMGTSALIKKDQQAAELHLELAAEEMPKSGAILNNLAVALAMKEDPDFERAYEISDAAINLVTNPTPHFYETRGQILFRMGKFEQAILDLERTLIEPSLSLKAHKMLADCYEKVGDPELAAAHREVVSAAEQETDNGQGVPGSRPKSTGG